MKRVRLTPRERADQAAEQILAGRFVYNQSEWDRIWVTFEIRAGVDGWQVKLALEGHLNEHLQNVYDTHNIDCSKLECLIRELDAVIAGFTTYHRSKFKKTG